MDAPSAREAVEQMARLIAEDLEDPEEPARAPAGGHERDVEAQDNGQNNAETCRELKKTKADDALAALKFLKEMTEELANAKEENRRLVKKNNDLITRRRVAEKKLLDAGQEGHMRRAKQELADAVEDLKLQSAEYRDLHESVARYQMHTRRARSQRDDAKKREEQSTSERNEAEGLLAEADATIKVIKGERNRAEKLLSEAKATIKTINFICKECDQDEIADPLAVAYATISSVQYMCVKRES
jgi:chromosome segregation ATPase